MEFDIHAVAQYVRGADTEELLDRVTVYRGGMEPEAIDLMEGELSRRGVRHDDVLAHAARRGDKLLTAADGTALKCSLCERPAVLRAWGWHRMFGKVPLFPREFLYCEEHDPKKGEHDPDADLRADDAKPD